MTHSHEFDCRQCGAHFDSQDELAKHTNAKHTAHASGSTDWKASRPEPDPGVDPDRTL